MVRGTLILITAGLLVATRVAGAASNNGDNGDGTITDPATGLMWEKKSDDGTLHDKDNTYVFTSTDGGTSPDGSLYTTFLAGLNAGNGFAGYTDWRIPTIVELETIVDYSVAYPGPAVSSVFDSSCVDSCSVTSCSCSAGYYYWSSTPVSHNSPYTWVVYPPFGSVEGADKSNIFHARAVRAGNNVAPNFADNGDGTITDNKTGLMWEKKSRDAGLHFWANSYRWTSSDSGTAPDGTLFTSFLAGLNAGNGFAGYTDWRIPTVVELETIIDYSTDSPSVSPAFNSSCVDSCSVTSCSCTGDGYYWSSSSVSGSPSHGWNIFFRTGNVDLTPKPANLFARAVRGGSSACMLSKDVNNRGNATGGAACDGGCAYANSDYDLLSRHAPILRYDRDELYVSLSVDALTASTGNYLERGDGTQTLNPNLATLGEHYANGESASDEDRLVATSTAGCDSACTSARWFQCHGSQVYGRVTSGHGRWLQYWYFHYRHTLEGDTRRGHEGDWAVVQMRLPNGSSQPDVVYYSQQDEGERCSWEQLETVDGHPVLYVSAGSHGFYRSAGTTLNDEGYDDSHRGDGPVPTANLKVITDTSPSWVTWPGRWGGTDNPAFTSPFGPAFIDEGAWWDRPDRLNWETCQ